LLRFVPGYSQSRLRRFELLNIFEEIPCCGIFCDRHSRGPSAPTHIAGARSCLVRMTILEYSRKFRRGDATSLPNELPRLKKQPIRMTTERVRVKE
jgi:hypothetical protein